MDYQVTTAPMHEPISLETAKRHLRIEHSDDDAAIGPVLGAARAWAEGYMHRACLWQTVTARRDDFADEMIVPLGPLIAVASITYVDGDGVTQTLDTSVYDVDAVHEPGRIIIGYNQTWPTCRGHHHDVTITYYAGHAAVCTRSVDALAVNGHVYRVNDVVQLYNIGGALPAGLAAATTYYVRAVSGHSIELAAAEGGALVAPTDDGTGTHYIDALPGHIASGILLRLTDLWANRGDEDLPVSRAIRDMLGLSRMVTI